MPDTIQITTSVPISAANGNTITFLYPQRANQPLRSGNSYNQDAGALLAVRDLQNSYVQNVDFTLAYSELQVVLTVISGLVIPAADGTNSRITGIVTLQLPLLVDPDSQLPVLPPGDHYNP